MSGQFSGSVSRKIPLKKQIIGKMTAVHFFCTFTDVRRSDLTGRIGKGAKQLCSRLWFGGRAAIQDALPIFT
jgi:hypothetical protein